MKQKLLLTVSVLFISWGGIAQCPEIVSGPPAMIVLCEGESLYLEVEASGANLQYQWYHDGDLMAGETLASIIISADAGSYYCVVNKPGCPAIACNPANVVVDQQVSVMSVSSSSADICEGDPFSMSIVADGNVLSYHWYRNNQPIPGADYPTYNVNTATTIDDGDYTCEVSGSCGSVLSSPSHINVNAAPMIMLQPTPLTTLCIGQTLHLSVSAVGSNLSYQWQKYNVDIPGATTEEFIIPSVIAIDAGNYNCTIDNFTCSAVSSDTATVVVTCLGTENNTIDEIQLYPNPASGKVTIQTGVYTGDEVAVGLYDLQGKLIISRKINSLSNQEVLDISNVQSGIYLVKINAAVGTVVRKLMIK